MPANHPLPGEVWHLPDQPTLTTSGEGGRAVVVDTSNDVVVLYSRSARRLVVPLRFFLLSWHFEQHALIPEQCSVVPCTNPAWFSQNVTPTSEPQQFYPVCWAHLVPNRETHLGVAPNTISGRCPACDAPSRFPGSVVNRSSEVDLDVHSCGRCRRDWVLVYPADQTLEACISLAERIGDCAALLEDRGLVARIRLGAEALEMVRQAVGALGEPPHLAGVPITVAELPRGPRAAYIIGHQPREIQRGVQRLGGQPDRTNTFTAANLEAPKESGQSFTNARSSGGLPRPKDLTVGASWWHKETFEEAYIVEIGSKNATKSWNEPTKLIKETFVKFRTNGEPGYLTLDAFLRHYQEQPPAPPCAVDEEWVDSQGNIVFVKTLAPVAAVVESQEGRSYLLPYKEFARWRKVERKSVYERLIDDPEEPV